jgi:hypothetical protein
VVARGAPGSASAREGDLVTVNGSPVVVLATRYRLPRQATGALVRTPEGHAWLLLVPWPQVAEMRAIMDDAIDLAARRKA